MDILDLDWHSGPVDSGYTLASASVDNHIMVWSVLPPANSVPSLVPSYGSSASSTLISPKRILSGHDSFVKGLSYDPVGRYLLSSGSDNRIIVWDAENEYSILKILDEPLRNAPDKTIFRRISWSPDGQSVCVTSAQKSSKPIGMVLKRGTWESVADLVGHTSSSISTKFCTHVLQHDTSQQQNGTNTKNSAPSVSCSVALGDQNGVLSVWSTHSNRPMYVLRDICDGAITDVAWARNTTQTALACCGIDGTVVIADFAGELGRALTTAALEKHFQTLYGRNMNELQQRPVALIENTLALKYALPPAPLSTSSSIVSTNGVANGQNGQKKRIDLRAVVCSSSSSSSNGVSANGGASPMSSFANRGANGSNNIVAQPMTAPASASNFSSASTLQQQQTTQIIGGKKRIRPVLMQNNLDTPSEVTSAAMPNHSSASAAGCAFDDFHNNNDDSGGAMDIGGDDSVMFRKGRADPPGLSHSQSAPQMPGALRQGNISQVPSTSSSSGVRSTFMPPPVGNITAAAVASVSGTTAAPSKVAAVVERVMTIRLENDETVCTVPLMAHQQVLRKVVKPAPVPFCTTNAATAISVPAVSPRFTSSGARAVSSAGASSGLGSIVLDPSIYANGASSSHGGGEFVGHHRASVPNFVLTAARLTKPALLAQLKHSGGKLSSLTLSSTSASTTAMNEGATAVGEGLWTAVVAGEVTCIAATEFGSSGAQLGGSMSGLCLVGCSDGTLHCIDLACGARVGPPIVLGGAVAYVDISTTESPPATVLLALAVTAEGEVWKWEVHPHTAKFRCAVRTNLRPVLLSMKCRSSGSQQGATSATGNSGAGGSSKDRKTVTIPAGASSSASATTAGTTPGNVNRKSDGVSIRIEQCVLSPAGEVVVHLMSATGGAEGGDWQAFSYEEGAMAWTRLADMRFVLSRYSGTYSLYV